VILTQDYLKNILDYNPETGDFTWLITPGKRIKAGCIAGSVNGLGYLIIKINNKNYKAHRLAMLYMTGKWPKDQADHINHIKNDNRIVNLREATDEENSKNAPKRKDNTSGITGVLWHSRDKVWQAQIAVTGKRKHLGYFDDKFESICARKSAENKYGYHENHGRPAAGEGIWG